MKAARTLNLDHFARWLSSSACKYATNTFSRCMILIAHEPRSSGLIRLVPGSCLDSNGCLEVLWGDQR